MWSNIYTSGIGGVISLTSTSLPFILSTPITHDNQEDLSNKNLFTLERPLYQVNH